MLTLIVSILFWCMRSKKKLGIAALILSALGAILDLVMYGPLGIIDVIVFLVNVFLFYKQGHFGSFGKGYDDDNDIF